jgi:hypothetical protein
MRKQLIDERKNETETKLKEYNKERNNTYNLLPNIFNNQITIKHLFGISQELSNYKKHYYYIENYLN